MTGDLYDLDTERARSRSTPLERRLRRARLQRQRTERTPPHLPTTPEIPPDEPEANDDDFRFCRCPWCRPGNDVR